MDTLVSRQLFLKTPPRNPVFLNSHTNSVFLHSLKRPAAVTDTIFVSRGRPNSRAFTVLLYIQKAEELPAPVFQKLESPIFNPLSPNSAEDQFSPNDIHRLS